MAEAADIHSRIAAGRLDGRADARSREDDRLFSSCGFDRVKGRESRVRHSPQSCGTCAAAEAGIIHAPQLNCAIVPLVRFEADPALSPIRIAVKAQHVKRWLAVSLRQLRARRPDFQLAILKWNGAALSSARFDAVGGWEENEPVCQAARESHHQI